MKPSIASLLVVATLSAFAPANPASASARPRRSSSEFLASGGGSAGAAAGKQTFTGVITDDMCAQAGHARMRMGPTDAECTLACVDVHGSAYVLYDGKNVYQLSDQKTPQQFAARKVKVTGTLDVKTKTIQVDSMIAVK